MKNKTPKAKPNTHQIKKYNGQLKSKAAKTTPNAHQITKSGLQMKSYGANARPSTSKVPKPLRGLKFQTRRLRNKCGHLAPSTVLLRSGRAQERIKTDRVDSKLLGVTGAFTSAAGACVKIELQTPRRDSKAPDLEVSFFWLASGTVRLRCGKALLEPPASRLKQTQCRKSCS